MKTVKISENTSDYTYYPSKVMLMLSLLILSCYQLPLLAQPVNSYVNDVVMPSADATNLGKYGDIPVSHFTGVPNISVPIYSYVSGTLNTSISLSYHASGVKVGELASRVGIGWSLNAGGMISRTVQGLADESGTYGFFDNGGNVPPKFIDEEYNCEFSDFGIDAGNGLADGEPDIFSFNVGGSSGKFYFNSDREAVLIPEQDVKIEMHFGTPSTTNYLSGFTIILPNGVRYYFGGEGAQEITRFDTSAPDIITGWYLSSIVSPDNLHTINFTYEREGYAYEMASSCNSTNICGSGSVNCLDRIPQMFVKGQRLINISGGIGSVDFEYINERLDVDRNTFSLDDFGRTLDKIQINNGSKCKEFAFRYDYYHDDTNFNTLTGKFNGSSDRRLRLDGMQEFSCNGQDQKPPYTFDYNIVRRNGEPYLPNRLSRAVDHWGFYNGADANNSYVNLLNIPPLTGFPHYTVNGAQVYMYPGQSDRETNETFMKYGILKKITYPSGGTTEFGFEANDYWGTKEDLVHDELVNFSHGNFPVFPVCGPGDTFSGTVEFDADDLDEIFVDLAVGTSPWTCNCTPQFNPGQLTYMNIKAYDLSTGSPVEVASSSLFQAICDGSEIRTSTSKLIDLFPDIEADVPYQFKIEGMNCFANVEIYIDRIIHTQDHIKVGGLRVKSIISDAISENPVIKTYSYESSSIPGRSSGVLFRKPRYWYHYNIPCSFTKGVKIKPNHPLFGEDCNVNICNSDGSYSTFGLANIVFADNSIVPLGSFEGYHIGYRNVKEHYPGSGYNAFNFRVEQGLSLNSFTNTMTYLGFPYPPEMPRIETGSRSASYTYNESGELVASSSNTLYDDDYTFNTDNFIKVLKSGTGCPEGGPLTFYNDYRIRTKPLRTASVTSVLDGVSKTTTYEYNGNNHLFATAEQFTNSDGKVYRTEYDYPTDVGNQCMEDAYVINSPVETRQYIGGALEHGSKIEYGVGGVCFYPSTYFSYEGGWRQEAEVTNYVGGFPNAIDITGWGTENYTFTNGLLTQKEFQGWTWSWEYDGTLVKRSAQPDGLYMAYDYDDLFRLTNTETNNEQVKTRFNYEYLPQGVNTIESTTTFASIPGLPTPPPRIDKQYYDGLGRFYNADGIGYSPEGEDVMLDIAKYDVRNRVTKQIYMPNTASTTLYEKNPLDRVEKSINPDGKSIKYTYGSEVIDRFPNYPLFKTVVEDENDNPTTTYTDLAGRTIRVVDALDGTTDYYYENDNDLAQVISPAGGFVYSYDEQHRVTKKTIPGGGTTNFLQYDDRDLLLRSEDPNGIITTIGYNQFGQPTATTIGGFTIDSEYDFSYLTRQTADIIDGNGGVTVQELGYDQFWRLQSDLLITPVGQDRKSYGYDAASNMVGSEQVHAGPYSIGLENEHYYDHRGRLLQTWQKINNDPNTRVLLHQNEYSARDELTGKNLFSKSGGASFLQSIGYGYNTMGWLTDINNTRKPVIDGPVRELCGLPSGPNEFPETETIVNIEQLIELIKSGEDFVIEDGDPCSEPPEPPCTDCPCEEEDCPPNSCNLGCPANIIQEQSDYLAELETQALSNLYSQNFSYPTNLKFVRLCNGTEAYLLDEELQSMPGNYEVIDVFLVNFSYDAFQSVCDGALDTYYITQVLQKRWTCNDFGIEGNNCEITSQEVDETCTYEIELSAFQHEVLENSATIETDYTLRVNKDCGSGVEIVDQLRKTRSVIYNDFPGLISSTTNVNINAIGPIVRYRLPNGSFIDGESGFVDYIKVHTLNPDTEFLIHFHPNRVFNEYPNLQGQFDQQDLYLSPVGVNADKTKRAYHLIVTEAIRLWEEQHNVQNTLVGAVIPNVHENGVNIGFVVYNITTAPYIGIDPARSAIYYYSSNSPNAPQIEKRATLYNTPTFPNFHETYFIPCGVLGTTYNYPYGFYPIWADNWFTLIATQEEPVQYIPPPVVSGGNEILPISLTCNTKITIYSVNCDPPVQVCNKGGCFTCPTDGTGGGDGGNHGNDGGPTKEEQDESLLAFRNTIDNARVEDLIFPTKLYRLRLMDYSQLHVFEQELSQIAGDYLIIGTLPLNNPEQIISVTNNGETQEMSIPQIIAARAAPDDDNSGHTTGFDGSEEEPCEPVPPGCSAEETALQASQVATVLAQMCTLDPSTLTFPITLHHIMLCDGSSMYVLEDMVDEINNYTLIEIITIDDDNDDNNPLVEVTIHPDNNLFGMHLNYYGGGEIDGIPYCNGNVSWNKWKVGNKAVQYYAYEYDPLDRLKNASYHARFIENLADSDPPQSVIRSIHGGRYDVFGIEYSASGDINQLSRKGFVTKNTSSGVSCFAALIDKMQYNYNDGRLKYVEEQAPEDYSHHGFRRSSDYEYDDAGNVIWDGGKEMTITYNPLNLPENIETPQGVINITYDATGRKLEKIADTRKEYLANVEYVRGEFEALYQADGRIVEDIIETGEGGVERKHRYEFTLSDHLGNARVNFSDLDGNNFITLADDPNTPEVEPIEILQENQYYPFGMNMDGQWSPLVGVKNQYQYNGKEFNEDFDIDLSDYGARWYDAAIGRWTTVDPLAEMYYDHSPYHYTLNNPIKYIDPNGMATALYGGGMTKSSNSSTNIRSENKTESSLYLEKTLTTSINGKEFSTTASVPIDAVRGIPIDLGAANIIQEIADGLATLRAFQNVNDQTESDDIIFTYIPSEEELNNVGNPYWPIASKDVCDYSCSEKNFSSSKTDAGGFLRYSDGTTIITVPFRSDEAVKSGTFSHVAMQVKDVVTGTGIRTRYRIMAQSALKGTSNTFSIITVTTYNREVYQSWLRIIPFSKQEKAQYGF